MDTNSCDLCLWCGAYVFRNLRYKMFDDEEINSLRDKVRKDEERAKKEQEFKELLQKDKQLNPTKTQLNQR